MKDPGERGRMRIVGDSEMGGAGGGAGQRSSSLIPSLSKDLRRRWSRGKVRECFKFRGLDSQGMWVGLTAVPLMDWSKTTPS